jgi:hypothetical protein
LYGSARNRVGYRYRSGRFGTERNRTVPVTEPTPSGTGTEPNRTGGRGVVADVAAGGFFLLLAAYKSGLWRDLRTHVFAGPDPLKDVWVLDWVARHLHRPGLVFEGNHFYPSHDAILFNDPMLGPALFAAPVRAAGGGSVFAYNVAVLLALAVASFGFYALARRLGADRGAALLPAVTVPYMPPQMQHLSHLNLLAITGFPFLVLGLLRLLRAPSVAVALATGSVFAWQASTSGYWAFAGALLALVIVAWGAPALARPRVLAGLALTAATAAGWVWPYVRGFRALRATEAALARGTADRADLSLDLVSGLWGTGAWIWQRAMPGPGDGATLAFPGLVIVVLAAVALRSGRRREVALLGAIALVFWMAALGPRVKALGHDVGPAPLALAEGIPLFDAMRHPATFVTLTLAALGLLAALGASALGLGRRAWAAVLVAGLALLEADTVPHRRVAVPKVAPPVYASLASLPPGAALELPLGFEEDSVRQWWSLQHGRSIVNGVGAFMPDRYVRLMRLVDKEWMAAAPATLEDTGALRYLKHQFPIQYVIVHADAPDSLRAAAASTPSLVPLVAAEGGALLFRLDRGGAGRVLRRAFRDDQFHEGRIAARLRGAAGTTARATFNDAVLGQVALGPDAAETAWAVAPLLRRGLNTLVLTAEGGAASTVELLEAAAR